MATGIFEIIVALITLIGVILTVFIGYRSSKRNLSHEIAKLKANIEQSFSSRILEERQRRYPIIYAEISSLAKRVKVQQDNYNVPEYNLSLEDLKVAFKKLQDLDSEHGLFYSNITSEKLAFLRDRIYKNISLLNDKNKTLPKEALDEIRNAMYEGETALKNDIGITIDEFQDIRVGNSEKDYFANLKRYSKKKK